MKNDLKTILYMGLGALSEVNGKVKELSDELYRKGKELYEKGEVVNEELKHKMNDVMKDNVTVVNINNGNTKYEIIDNIEKLSSEEREELFTLLNKKGWTDYNNEEREGLK